MRGLLQFCPEAAACISLGIKSFYMLGLHVLLLFCLQSLKASDKSFFPPTAPLAPHSIRKICQPVACYLGDLRIRTKQQQESGSRNVFGALLNSTGLEPATTWVRPNAHVWDV
jgi:hypothetical protein